MKTFRHIVYAVALLLCFGCKTQQELVSCEDVSKTTDMPWLASLEEGYTQDGLKLLNIDKIVYSTDDSNTTSVGFELRYELVCCDRPDRYICDCDGKIITTYGGIAGCIGVCGIKVLSRVNLYNAE